MSKTHSVLVSWLVLGMLGAILFTQIAFLASSSNTRQALAPIARTSQLTGSAGGSDEFDPPDVPVWAPPPGTARKVRFLARNRRSPLLPSLPVSLFRPR